MIAQRRQLNSIHNIYDVEGMQLTEPESVKKHIINFYKQLLGTKRERVNINKMVMSNGAVVSDRASLGLLYTTNNRQGNKNCFMEYRT